MYLHTNAHPKDKSFRVFCGDMHLDANVKKVYFMAYEITYILSIFRRFYVFIFMPLHLNRPISLSHSITLILNSHHPVLFGNLIKLPSWDLSNMAFQFTFSCTSCFPCYFA